MLYNKLYKYTLKVEDPQVTTNAEHAKMSFSLLLLRLVVQHIHNKSK